MIVRCTDCNAAYVVDDGKIENKKFGFTCPKCGTNVIIDNRRKAAEEPAPVSGIEEFEENPMSNASPAAGDVDFDRIESALSEEKTKSLADEEAGLEEEPLSLGDFESGLEVGAGEKKPAPDEVSVSDELDEALFLGEEENAKASMAAEDAEEREEKITLGDDIPLDDLILDDSTSQGSPRKSPAKAAASIERDLMPGEDLRTDQVFSSGEIDVDEGTTIDLDSLDIELGEEETKKSEREAEDEDFGALIVDEMPPERAKTAVMEDEESDTTIDLDTLDITLDEEEELKKGVSVDEDERLSLEDAGLSMDELGAEDAKAAARDEFIEEALGEEEEDIKLNLKEIDPKLSVDDLSGETASAGLITDDFAEEKLPEIDLDKLQEEEAPAAATRSRTAAEDFLDLESKEEFDRYRDDLMEGAGETRDVVPGGCVNFSIDYSLSYSRFGAVLRLIGLYTLAMVPHLIVLMVYGVLSTILGFFNWLIILLTGYGDEDFAEIQEKTARYMLSIAACASDIIEDYPAYAGKKNIDYPLQLNVVYPVRHSRVLAFLRLTVVGIVIAALPHLLLLSLLSLGAWLITIAGLVSIIAVRKWPGVLFDFMRRYFNYAANVFSFVTGIVDKYPSFRFE